MSFAHMHAYAYADCLAAIDGAELTSVWDDNPKRGRAAARRFGARFTANQDKFFARNLDAVIVCSENTKHRGMIERAAGEGVWILSEKPLATTTKDAKAIVRTCEGAGVGLGTAFPCRYVFPIVEARKRLLDGEFGEICAVSCTNHGQFPGGWFSDVSLSGGGAVMDHTVHVVDVLRWMLEKEFTKVYCEGGNQVHGGAIATDDLGSLHLEMEGGVQVSHVGSWSRPKSFPTWGDVTLEFIGTKGVLNVDAFNQKVTVYNDVTMNTVWAYWGDDANRALVGDFVEAVQEERTPTITGFDGVQATAVTEAAYASMRTGKVVRIRR